MSRSEEKGEQRRLGMAAWCPAVLGLPPCHGKGPGREGTSLLDIMSWMGHSPPAALRLEMCQELEGGSCVYQGVNNPQCSFKAVTWCSPFWRMDSAWGTSVHCRHPCQSETAPLSRVSAVWMVQPTLTWLLRGYTGDRVRT